MAAVTAVLIGAGLRGRHTYGRWALQHPDRLRLVALAEPDAERARILAREHGLPAERVFPDWKALLDRPALGDVAIIATGDRLHVAPALAALERGHHVLLEKPIAPTAAECQRVVAAAERAGRALQIGHVLRHTRFYQTVRELVERGELGRLVSMDMRGQVAHWHMTHSYVRGKFRNRAVAAPLLLAKSVHDLDLLAWFADRPAVRVASFGALTLYRRESAPPEAPERCTDGCPVQASCPYDAVRFYLDPPDELAAGWPWSDVSPDPSRPARRHALETGPYGRCVYRCDNDVVDHQVVIAEFADGLTASFGLHGHAVHEERALRLTGSRGELRGLLHAGTIEVRRPGSLEVERREVRASPLDHFGGDDGLLDHFTAALARGAWDGLLASGRVALEAHLIGFAAEAARSEARCVEMGDFRSHIPQGSQESG